MFLKKRIPFLAFFMVTFVIVYYLVAQLGMLMLGTPKWAEETTAWQIFQHIYLKNVLGYTLLSLVVTTMITFSAKALLSLLTGKLR